MLIKLLF